LNFSFEALDQAGGAIRRLDACIHLLNRVKRGHAYRELDQLLYDIKAGFTDAMDNDLDIPSALASVFRIVRKINGLVTHQEMDQRGARRIKDAFRRIDEVLNVFDFEEPALDAQVQELIRQREEARQMKDWPRADEIRDRLRAMGVEVKDKKIS
jgi:cysteinyl-tRNA synthetase